MLASLGKAINAARRSAQAPPPFPISSLVVAKSTSACAPHRQSSPMLTDWWSARKPYYASLDSERQNGKCVPLVRRSFAADIKETWRPMTGGPQCAASDR